MQDRATSFATSAHIWRLVAFIVAWASTGCFRTLPQVRVVSDGTRIVADDGSFEIETGQVAPAEPEGRFSWEYGRRRPRDLQTTHADASMRDAKRVRVWIEGRSEPLYGLLRVHRIPTRELRRWPEGESRRFYSIGVDSEAVARVDAGELVAVYEGHTVDGREQKLWWNGWILWLSREPIGRPLEGERAP